MFVHFSLKIMSLISVSMALTCYALSFWCRAPLSVQIFMLLSTALTSVLMLWNQNVWQWVMVWYRYVKTPLGSVAHFLLCFSLSWVCWGRVIWFIHEGDFWEVCSAFPITGVVRNVLVFTHSLMCLFDTIVYP